MRDVTMEAALAGRPGAGQQITQVLMGYNNQLSVV